MSCCLLSPFLPSFATLIVYLYSQEARAGIVLMLSPPDLYGYECDHMNMINSVNTTEHVEAEDLARVKCFVKQNCITELSLMNV